MDEALIAKYLTETFEGVDVVTADGNSFFFYDPERALAVDRRWPFVTVVANDLYDRESKLDRAGVFRVNIGVGKETYRGLFGEAGGGAGGFDFAALDVVMPHPVYGAQYWVCVLNPGERTWERVRGLLAEAYALAVRRHAK